MNLALTYPLEDFTPAAAVQAVQRARKAVGAERASSDAPTELPTVDIDQLASKLPEAAFVVIVHGMRPDEPDHFPSRSHAVFYAACEMVRAGLPREEIAAVLIDPTLAISEHVREKGGQRLEEYALRQADRAAEAVASDFECDGSKPPKIVRNSLKNIRVALAKLNVELRFDKHWSRAMIAGLDGFGPMLDDPSLVALWLKIDETFRFRPQYDFFVKVVQNEAQASPYHPVVEYLEGLAWDGESRVDGWLAAYCGAEDTAYTRAVGVLLLLAAVRRVRQPGVKFDEMVVLEGDQGTGKSSALRIMAVREEWFNDNLPIPAEPRQVIESVEGCWIIEASELKGMRKSDVESLKAFLSRQLDEARMAYGRMTSRFPRQFVVVGTTNADRYLRDTTGNRRFLPVRTGRFDLGALFRDRDQLWAEAAVREATGESIRLDPALYEAAQEEQEGRRMDDPFYDTLLGMLGEIEGRIRAVDVWAILGKADGHRQQEENARMGDAMRLLGFKRTKLRFDSGPPENCYVRGDARRPMVLIRAEGDPAGHVIAVSNGTTF